MTKKKKWILSLIPFITLLGFIFWKFRSHQSTSQIDQPPKSLSINGRRIINPRKEMKVEDLNKITPINIPSPEWKKAVEKSLRAQGGETLTTVS